MAAKQRDEDRLRSTRKKKNSGRPEKAQWPYRTAEFAGTLPGRRWAMVLPVTKSKVKKNYACQWRGSTVGCFRTALAKIGGERADSVSVLVSKRGVGKLFVQIGPWRPRTGVHRGLSSLTTYHPAVLPWTAGARILVKVFPTGHQNWPLVAAGVFRCDKCHRD